MKIKEAIEAIHDFFSEYLVPPHKVTTLQPKEKGQGWRAVVEVIEEKEYMKAYAKDQLIGVYEVELDKDFQVRHFERKSLRPRSSARLDAE
ncbi:gas vesicle protein GvpO [Salinithrix halophila]|uniref:Gas vesicle protein GvpO n=1 Tax=Salinithrix halophila TaxID=1485204 RepID=A0ABV8JF34_9BACL